MDKHLVRIGVRLMREGDNELGFRVDDGESSTVAKAHRGSPEGRLYGQGKLLYR